MLNPSLALQKVGERVFRKFGYMPRFRNGFLRWAINYLRIGIDTVAYRQGVDAGFESRMEIIKLG